MSCLRGHMPLRSLDRGFGDPRTYLPPHKAGRTAAGGCHRLIVRLAFGGATRSAASVTVSFAAAAKSYTVDTLKQLTRENPANVLPDYGQRYVFIADTIS